MATFTPTPMPALWSRPPKGVIGPETTTASGGSEGAITNPKQTRLGLPILG